MKKIKLSIVFLLLSISIYAQDNFYQSQYFQLGPSLNPATTGIDNFLDIKLNYRSQWGGFTDAPSTNYLAINGYLQKETQKTYRQYSLRTSDPHYLDSLSRGEITLSEKIRHGIGGHVVYDVQGPYEEISAHFNYALHIPLNEKIKVSLGISTAVTNKRLDLEKIALQNPDDDKFYQSLIAAGGKSTYLDINPGIMIYGDRFYLSYASFRVFRKPLSSDEILSETKNNDQNLMAGFKISLSDRVQLLPSILYNINAQYDNIWNTNFKLMINDKTWAGVSYRTTGAMTFMAGVYINNLFNLGYSYDYLTNNLNNYTNGSHEITLGLMLFKKDLKAPYLW